MLSYYMNTRTGTIVGKYLEEVTNDNERQLICLSESFNLKILNVYWKQKNLHKFNKIHDCYNSLYYYKI